MDKLGRTLEALYRQRGLRSRILRDPVEFPHRYRRPLDRETAGFIAACLSYGKVGLFKPVIEKILRIAGTSPYDFVLNFDVRENAPLFDGVRYRMNTTKDIVAFLHLLSGVLRQHGSIGGFFRSAYRREDPNLLRSLSLFTGAFYAGDTSAVYGRNIRPFGLVQMLPSPDRGSTCKRSHLFLRWMVRAGDGIDFGIWNFVTPDKLILPLDTHTARIARHLGLTGRKSMDIKTAIDITDTLKRFDPADPVKYDFALCHFGISGKCPAKKTTTVCLACSLKGVCMY